MHTQVTPLHVYQRTLPPDTQHSLGLLASWIPAGARVLDLGCGAGGLGQLLRARGIELIDGLTYNPAEAEVARPWYRRVEVVDLETCDLATLLGGQRYDAIVCADVLEHLRAPEKLLDQCRHCLAPRGQLLASIPNAGHAGLIGELLDGRLTYREEGLLDRTHLRFFTRRSWLGFLAEHGWGATRLESIYKEVPLTEFRLAFDLLPPAVAQYLCALPDGQAYQFITACVPDVPHRLTSGPSAGPTAPSFGSTLYWDLGTGFQEGQKALRTGVIGQVFQTLTYPLPQDPALCGLRLDPSDRPGFMRWHRIELQDAQGQPVWVADCQQSGLASLDACTRHQIALSPAISEHSGLLSVLEGDDPWLELPRDLPWHRLAGGSLRVSLGWPASNDYLALLEHLQALQPTQVEMARMRQAWAKDLSRTRTLEQQLAAIEHEWQHERTQAIERHERLQLLQASLQQAEQALELARLAAHPASESRVWGLLRRVWRCLRKAQAKARSTALPAPASGHAPSLPGVQASRTEAEPARVATDAAPSAPGPVADAAAPMIDIIVPVYRGLEDTRLCLLSVLAHPQHSPYRLIVINDASPEPALTAWLREWQAEHPHVILLENSENLGFVATVNRGMACSDSHDVLLLNSDTEVANDWLDRLRRAAYSAVQIASVTPFSNNATICSYPRFCEGNALPEGLDTPHLDRLFAHLNAGLSVDIPTAIGFCMYIRRDALRVVGEFDVAHFGKGYGEENDFCCRATQAGWRHLHALDTFVLHRGGVSFGDSKNERERAALRTLIRLHPGYEQDVQRFVASDPARPARQRVDRARLLATGRPKVLAVSHNGAGGTLQHIQELATLLAQQADFLLLQPFEGGRVTLRCVNPAEGFLEAFQMPDDAARLRDELRQLGVVHVHFHHLMDHGGDVLNLPRDLQVSADFTAHDFYPLCPQLSLVDANGRYCGEQGLDQCQRCLVERPAPDRKSIEQWHRDHRHILMQMRFILAPSQDTARRLQSFVPEASLRLAPHTDLPAGTLLPSPQPPVQAPGRRLKVAVIGALSVLKGADLLEQVALLAAREAAEIDFHLLGHAYRDLCTQPQAHLTVHGRYQGNDLPALLAWLQPDLVWFPVQAPETYSYTLSACLRAGLPVAAPALGAFPARLAGRPWTWIQPWDSSSLDWLRFFQDVRDQHFATGIGPTLPAPEWRLTRALPWPDFDYLTEYLPRAVPQEGG